MAMPIEACIQRVEGWIESIQREKDRLSVLMRQYHDCHDSATEIQYAFAVVRLETIDRELIEARLLLADLESKRHRPELILQERPLPQMLKATLAEKKAAKRA